ncbi:hypothetical protein HaLaN_03583, partial [Haematococcus lacustris]
MQSSLRPPASLRLLYMSMRVVSSSRIGERSRECGNEPTFPPWECYTPPLRSGARGRAGRGRACSMRWAAAMVGEGGGRHGGSLHAVALNLPGEHDVTFNLCNGCNIVEDTVEEGGCNPVIP